MNETAICCIYLAREACIENTISTLLFNLALGVSLPKMVSALSFDKQDSCFIHHDTPLCDLFFCLLNQSKNTRANCFNLFC